MDQGITELTRRHCWKSLLQCKLLAYDCNKGYSIYLLGTIRLMCRSWSDLQGITITNCFAHMGSLHASIVAEPVKDLDFQVNEGSDSLHRRVHVPLGQEVGRWFDTFAQVHTNVPAVNPVADVETVVFISHQDVGNVPESLTKSL